MPVGFGVAGALPAEMIREIAPRVERLGYSTFWVNDTPDGDGLAALAEAAAVTSSIRLAVGVIPVDRIPGREIARRVEERDLPRDRLLIGLGSGRAERPLAEVRHAIDELRESLNPPVAIAAGALGPRMVQLGAEVGDGVLLNWLTPFAAAESAQAIRDSRSESAETIAYVRVALGDQAILRLEGEAERYAGFPSYANHFRRMGVEAIETTVRGTSSDALRKSVDEFSEALDEVVVRAITADDAADEYLRLAEVLTPLGVEN